MKKSRTSLVVAISVLVLLLLGSCTTSKDLVRTIEVTGTGTVTLQPDIATFSIQVSEVGPTTSEAQSLANEKMSLLLDTLRSNGARDSDIKTTALNLRPSYKWIEGKQVLEGQVASQSLEVILRTIDMLGSVMDQLGKVSGIYVNSVQMDKEDKREEIVLARQKAVADALAKAAVYASSTNMRVGNPITISEYSVASNPYNARAKVMMASEAYDMPTEIPTGSMTVSSTVSMVLQLL